jgi:hypothetical protein
LLSILKSSPGNRAKERDHYERPHFIGWGLFCGNLTMSGGYELQGFAIQTNEFAPYTRRKQRILDTVGLGRDININREKWKEALLML